jgi:hypothetical protein
MALSNPNTQEDYDDELNGPCAQFGEDCYRPKEFYEFPLLLSFFHFIDWLTGR